MKRITRREFLRLASVSAAGALATKALTACGTTPSAIEPLETDVSGTVAPGTILRNENLPGFNVRYYNPFPAPDPSQWRLSVEGLVGRPQSLSLDDVQRLVRHRHQAHEVCGVLVRASQVGGFRPRLPAGAGGAGA